MSPRPIVCFVTLVLSQYRIPFHRLVRDLLAARGIEYRLVYSDPIGAAASKADTAALDWAIKVPVSAWSVFGKPLYWQSARGPARDAALTVVSQENKLLFNYWALVRYLASGSKFGYFGHGRSSSEGLWSALGRPLKRLLATRVHWWFAYTPEVRALLHGYGFPPDRISVNYNSIDTVALRAELDSVSAEEVAGFRRRHKLGNGPVGLYLGAIYPDKRVDLLIAAARAVREAVPDFQLLIVGAGPDACRAEAAARDLEFVHCAGPLFGRDKAVALKIGRACLIPAAVGLAVLDSFAAGCPLVTTAGPGHGPEIAYLEHGGNGVVAPRTRDAQAYAEAIIRVMTDDDYHGRLREGGLAAAERYTIENMARHFADGVVAALQRPAAGRRSGRAVSPK